MSERGCANVSAKKRDVRLEQECVVLPSTRDMTSVAQVSFAKRKLPTPSSAPPSTFNTVPTEKEFLQIELMAVAHFYDFPPITKQVQCTCRYMYKIYKFVRTFKV